ncbi:MAG TPA: hypothetical protein ENI86_17065, partial [Acidimicrobiales bacterium]|nr:hypothetical protein [Acidimicrobiales bacterium]
MIRKRWTRGAALLLALALLAAACGDSGGTGESSASSSDDTTATTAEATTTTAAGGDTTEATEAPSTTEAMEAPTFEGVVELGADTSVNLDECPEDWDPYGGITDDEIRVAFTLPRSGALASFGAMADGIRAYFDWVNANDPVDGKKLVLIDKDDAYESGQSIANVEEFLGSENVFAVSTLGSPNNLAVRPILTEACVPQLFTLSGLPQFGDPQNWPWTIGGLLNYTTESSIWCENIVDELGEGATVAALFMNNDFGLAYRPAMEQCDADGKIDLVVSEVHEPGAPDITSEMTTMAASGADAFVLGSTSKFCPQAMVAIAQSDWDPQIKFVSTTCSNLAAFFKPVDPAGVGIRVVSVAKAFSDPAYTDDEGVQFGIDVLEQGGLDPFAGTASFGLQFGWLWVQSMRDALEMPGGLNRVNFQTAVWNLDTESPFYLNGMTVKTDGANDA